MKIQEFIWCFTETDTDIMKSRKFEPAERFGPSARTEQAQRL